MYRKLLGTLIVTLSLMFSPVLFADCGHRLKDMLESLQLSDAQKAQIKPIIEQMKSTMHSTKEQMDALKSQIHEQMHSASMDKDAVNSLVDKKAALIGTMMKTRIAAMNQVFSTLTAEQKVKLQGMMKEAKEKMAEKFKSCHDHD